jgi:hypothetical protein
VILNPQAMCGLFLHEVLKYRVIHTPASISKSRKPQSKGYSIGQGRIWCLLVLGLFGNSLEMITGLNICRTNIRDGSGSTGGGQQEGYHRKPTRTVLKIEEYNVFRWVGIATITARHVKTDTFKEVDTWSNMYAYM